MKNRKSQSGFIVSIELIFLATILVIGLVVGWVDVRDSVLAELSDISEAVGSLNQSYAIDGVQNIAKTAQTAGDHWQDLQDTANGLPNSIDQATALNYTTQGDIGQTSDVSFTAAGPGSNIDEASSPSNVQ